MFIWDGTLRNVCSTLDSNCMHHSIRVFEGDFTNPGDLDKIVDTCLGLWATPLTRLLYAPPYRWRGGHYAAI